MTNPMPPKEGALIESARSDARLSVRESARRAGISEGWWRQIVKGSQTLSGGGHGIVRGPAETVAKMAHVVGVTPEQLRDAGRSDAADEFEKLASMPIDPPPPRLAAVMNVPEGSVHDLVGRLLTDPLELMIWDTTSLSEDERLTHINALRAKRAELAAELERKGRDHSTGLVSVPL